jgi:broad specificity phosphatase PhoE
MAENYDKLSPIGESQSRVLGEYWASRTVVFQQIFCGPAQRHLRTMEIAGDVIRRAGLPWPEPQIIPEFDEFDAFQVMKIMLPILVERNDTVREMQQQFLRHQQTPDAGRLLEILFQEVAAHWCSGEFETPNLESWPQFRERVERGIAKVRAGTPRSSSSVVFTSGGPIAATIGHVLDLSHRKAIEFVWHSRNASFSEFLSSGSRFSLSSFNSFPHLTDKSLLSYR